MVDNIKYAYGAAIATGTFSFFVSVFAFGMSGAIVGCAIAFLWMWSVMWSISLIPLIIAWFRNPWSNDGE